MDGKGGGSTQLLLRVFVEGFVEACCIEEGMDTIIYRVEDGIQHLYHGILVRKKF